MCKGGCLDGSCSVLAELGSFPPLLSPVCPLWYMCEFPFLRLSEISFPLCRQETDFNCLYFLLFFFLYFVLSPLPLSSRVPPFPAPPVSPFLPPSPPSPRLFFSFSIRNNVCGIISRPRPALLPEPCLYCQVSGGRRRWWPWGPATPSPKVDKSCRRGDIVCVFPPPHLPPDSLLPVGDGSPRQLGLSPSSSSSL